METTYVWIPCVLQCPYCCDPNGGVAKVARVLAAIKSTVTKLQQYHER